MKIISDDYLFLLYENEMMSTKMPMVMVHVCHHGNLCGLCRTVSYDHGHGRERPYLIYDGRQHGLYHGHGHGLCHGRGHGHGSYNRKVEGVIWKSFASTPRA